MPSLARLLQLAQQLSFLYVIVRIGRELWLVGLVPTLKRIFLATLKAAPGGQRLLNSQIDNEARTAVAQLLAAKGYEMHLDRVARGADAADSNAVPALLELPKKGLGPKEALEFLKRLQGARLMSIAATHH